MHPTIKITDEEGELGYQKKNASSDKLSRQLQYSS